jgi:hypothetical protein
VTHYYDAGAVTLCMPGCDYIDITFRAYRQLVAVLMSWTKITDATPPVGVPVLLVTTRGVILSAARMESGNYKCTTPGLVEARDVEAWALMPPYLKP